MRFEIKPSDIYTKELFLSSVPALLADHDIEIMDFRIPKLDEHYIGRPVCAICKAYHGMNIGPRFIVRKSNTADVIDTMRNQVCVPDPVKLLDVYPQFNAAAFGAYCRTHCVKFEAFRIVRAGDLWVPTTMTNGAFETPVLATDTSAVEGHFRIRIIVRYLANTIEQLWE